MSEAVESWGPEGDHDKALAMSPDMPDLFVLRGFRVAHVAQDGFSKLLAAGLTFGFALQTFIILGGVLRIIPLTGITLPFVSYGGSSVVANFVLVAGLLLVSHRANARR